MTSKEFWNYVEDERENLGRAHRERFAEFARTQKDEVFGGQPRHGKSLFIVTKKNLSSRAVEGRVCECPIRLAAQRIVEQTHEIASADQIAGYLDQQRDSAAIITATERRTQRRHGIVEVQ